MPPSENDTKQLVLASTTMSRHVLLVLLVLAISHQVTAAAIDACSNLLECITTASCVERHRNASSDAISSTLVFKCGPIDADTVCCPALPRSHLEVKNHLMGFCTESAGHRIANGNASLLGEFPWMALIGIKRQGSKSIQYICGGSLISRRYVLTAAHCVVNVSTVVQVRLAEHDLRTVRDCEQIGPDIEDVKCQNATDVRVARVTVHREYSSMSKTLEHDIALIRLKHDVDLEQEEIWPICLPFNGTGVFAEGNYTVTGWGMTHTKRRSDVLLKARVMGMSIEDCNSGDHPLLVDDDKQGCGNTVYNGVACHGDSGGPLMTRWTKYNVLVGIVSFARDQRKCYELGAITVYTRVHYYLNWIMDNIEL